MRVARVSYEFSPQKGGSVTNMIELLKQMSKRQIEQIVFVPSRTGENIEKPLGASDLVKINTMATDNNSIPIQLRILYFALRLSREIKKQNDENKMDIIHVNGFLLGSTLSFLLRILGVHTPFIITRDGGFGDRNTTKHVVSELVSYISIIFSRAHFFIVDDGTDVESCLNYLDKLGKKYTVVRTAVDCSNIKPKDYSITDSEVIKIVSTHRLIEFKNIHDSIISFIATSRKSITIPAEFIIIGTGAQEPILKKLVEIEGVNNIIFLGEMDHQRIIEILPNCDIFIATSRISNVNLSVLEGMASMLPILAYNSGGTNRLIKNFENGILIDVNDIQGLSEALDLLIRDKELRYKLGSAARCTVQMERSWDCVVDDYYRVYCTLFKETRL